MKLPASEFAFFRRGFGRPLTTYLASRFVSKDYEAASQLLVGSKRLAAAMPKKNNNKQFGTLAQLRNAHLV